MLHLFTKLGQLSSSEKNHLCQNIHYELHNAYSEKATKCLELIPGDLEFLEGVSNMCGIESYYLAPAAELTQYLTSC